MQMRFARELRRFHGIFKAIFTTKMHMHPYGMLTEAQAMRKNRVPFGRLAQIGISLRQSVPDYPPTERWPSG